MAGERRWRGGGRAALALAALAAGAGGSPAAAQEVDGRLDAALRRALASLPAASTIPVVVEWRPARPPGPGLLAVRRAAELRTEALRTLAERPGLRVRRRFWVVPAALVEADAEGVRALAALPEVERVWLDERIPVALEPTASARAAPSFTSDAMRTIGADAVWEDGATGEGQVIAFFDTGVDGAHAMLADRWRGRRTGLRASWFDPFRRASEPLDGIGHGTQVALAALGALPAGDTLRLPDGTEIVAASDLDVVTGTAPRAEWIAARVFETFGRDVYTRRSVLLQAFEWALDPDGVPSTDDAPDVINNSWGIFAGTDGFDPCDDVLFDAIDAAEAAGIAVLFAAGNGGPAPGSVTAPASRDDPALRSFAVGATQGTGGSIEVWEFSGRGPSPCDGGIKPEVVAPTTVPQVRADGPGSVRLTTFIARGTSFAVAQASGAVAVMRQLRPGATPEEAKRLLLASATDLPPAGPDNDTGFGLLDLPAAARAANPAFAGARLQLDPSSEGAAPRLWLVNRGDRTWPGGRVVLEPLEGAPVQEPVGSLPPGRRTALPLPAGGPTGLRVTVEDLDGTVRLARSLLLAPPDVFGGFVLEDGALEAGGNDFGRLGRVAAFRGFRWREAELLPAAGFLVAGRGRLSDAIYTDVLEQPGLKTLPPAVETDWAPRRSRTDVETDRAFAVFDDLEALAPVGVEVAVRLAASDRDGVAALALTAEVRNRSGTSIPDLATGIFADWDLTGGETVRWDPTLRALVIEPMGGGPRTLVAADRPVGVRRDVPLGTPDGTGFYGVGSGVLADGVFEEELKRRLVEGESPALPGDAVATDRAALLVAGTRPLGAGETDLVRYWLLAADDLAAAGARLGELRAEPPTPPGGGGSRFEVQPPFPNPLRVGEGAVTFPYSLPDDVASDADLEFEIYDLAGRRLLRRRAPLSGGARPVIVWDGRLGSGGAAASGVYLFVLRLGDETRSGRVMIVR